MRSWRAEHLGARRHANIRPVEMITLVREEDGFHKEACVDIWSYGGVHKARVTFEAPKYNEVQFSPERTSEKAAEKDARASLERLRREGWKDELTPTEQSRIDARIDRQREEKETSARDHQARLDRFPASEVDRRLAAAIARPDGVVQLDLRGSEDNRISILPPTIKKLKSLEVLRLDGNQLTTLPEQMDALEKLRVLGLARNLLTDPRPACYLRKLVLLDLHDNRLTASYAGAHQKGLEVQLAGNPIGKDGPLGWFTKTRALGIDTDTLFPIGDRVAEPSKSVEVVQLYGRAPTEAERLEAKKWFPKARIEHYSSIADGPHIAFPVDGAAEAPVPATPRPAVPKRRTARKPHPK